MKKLAITALAGLMAVLGTASIASANSRRGDDEMWRYHDRRGDDRHARRDRDRDDEWRRDHRGPHWRHHHHRPHIVFRDHFRNDYCFVKKVRAYDRWGNMYIKRVRVCR